MWKILKKIKKSFILVLLLFFGASIFLALSSEDIFATEGGGGAYPNGAEDFMSGAVPPPGTYFINYLIYYHADEFNNGRGENVDEDFDLDVIVNVFRFIHITKHKILGGYWGMHMFIPVVYQEVSVGSPGGILSDTQTGVGDIIVDPIILSWHSKNFHFATGVDIYIPTGRYDAGRGSNEFDIANTSRNYWTFEPIVAFTYQSDFGLEVSSKFMYDINTNNPDTDYRSGQEFHFDYTLGYKINNWRIGVGGYYYKQITDDKLNGKVVEFPKPLGFPDGFKGQAIAVGPQLKYDYKNMSFILKYHREFEIENRPEGDNFWFKFVYAF
ncbi:MAG: transporter [Nitrospirae bacterium]|nr:transporter [Nitrospirota bacterium]